MSERKSHYAACHDCPGYKWVTSQERADEAAEEHGEMYPDHDTYIGTVDMTVAGMGMNP